ncbi:MAG: cytochrome c family protein [Myxococcales bacterium]|jgi:hypothetical protein|nr:cytochrome c family protein [Myxococcales bacterium]MDH3843924.1 cytochrome c family protein [Myxococcales bacterium]
MQIFPRELNYLPLVLALVAGALGTGVFVLFWVYFTPSNLQVGYTPTQPVAYSHRLHAGELGMDCRYCHSQVERSHEAMVPPTQTCMGCHALVRTESAQLAAIRSSWETGESIAWVRVNKVPDHAFFNHSIHLAGGVGCVSCHGRIDQMEVVGIVEPLAMQWCLDCHRNPEPHIRPTSEVTNMGWQADETWLAQRAEVASQLNPPMHCSGCHR